MKRLKKPVMGSRRVVKKDLKPGNRIIKATVGEYAGPGFEPRVFITETVLLIQETHQLDQKNHVYVINEKNDVETAELIKDILGGKEKSRVKITYWTCPVQTLEA